MQWHCERKLRGNKTVCSTWSIQLRFEMIKMEIIWLGLSEINMQCTQELLYMGLHIHLVWKLFSYFSSHNAFENKAFAWDTCIMVPFQTCIQRMRMRSTYLSSLSEWNIPFKVLRRTSWFIHNLKCIPHEFSVSEWLQLYIIVI